MKFSRKKLKETMNGVKLFIFIRFQNGLAIAKMMLVSHNVMKLV